MVASENDATPDATPPGLTTPPTPPPVDHQAGGHLGANVVDTNSAEKKSGGEKNGLSPKQRRRLKKAFLQVGGFPRGAEAEGKQLKRYWLRVLEELERLYGGELGFWHEHLLSAALEAERHRLMSGWLLREGGVDMTAMQQRETSAKISQATERRNRAVRELFGKEKRTVVAGREPDPAWDKSGDE